VSSSKWSTGSWLIPVCGVSRHVARTFNLGKLPKRLIDTALMQPWVSGPLHVFGNDLCDRRWVFVLGCYNSGTTLLAEMLQAHPLLVGMRNEGAFLTDSLPYPERFGWPRMWSECEDMLRISEDDEKRALRIKKHWSLWVRGSQEYVVEKSISNSTRIRFLQNNFSNAKFVHIVRNGYAVAAGIRRKANLRRWKNPKGYQQYPLELCARQWAESVRIVDEEVTRGAPIVSITYEDLVSNPTGTLNPVFKFIGVDPIQDKAMWGTMNVHESSSEIRDMNSASISNLSKVDREVVRNAIGEKLSRFGYECGP